MLVEDCVMYIVCEGIGNYYQPRSFNKLNKTKVNFIERIHSNARMRFSIKLYIFHNFFISNIHWILKVILWELVIIHYQKLGHNKFKAPARNSIELIVLCINKFLERIHSTMKIKMYILT